MAIKINFDPSNTPEPPSFILAQRNGQKLGLINAKNIVISDSLNDASEVMFTVHKYIEGKREPLWDDVDNFKLVWCKEWDVWFGITVEIDESSSKTSKTVSCKRLGQSELSQIMLYNVNINTEDDIARDDYSTNTHMLLYNSEHPESSILHRVMEKAPHYSIIHIDSTLANIKKIYTFTFDNTSIYDALQKIAEEVGCLFVFNSNSDENGKIQRTISVYDLESNCKSCGHRGEFTGECPKCHSNDINEGYGTDTTIFITSDELAENIQFTTDTDSVKNCFKLEGGDDLMTATIQNCNPNGTDHIWHITDDMKNNMSDELRQKLNDYDNLYKYYQSEHEIYFNDALDSCFREYNDLLVPKYSGYYHDIYKRELSKIPYTITGYPALMTAYYDTVDFSIFLQSVLMPNVDMANTNATEQAALLTTENLSPVAITSLKNISLATVESAVLAMAKVVVDARFQVKIGTSALSADNTTWNGSFIVTNYSDDEDTATSDAVSITINDDYEAFVKQKIDKALNKKDTEDLSISGLFEKTEEDFKTELTKYCLKSLTSIHDACQGCIDILIEQGVADHTTWSGKEPNLYDDLYVPYYSKLGYIEEEMKVRQGEINTILGIYDSDNTLVKDGVQTLITQEKESIQKALNFQSYLGEELWLEFCAYRREDKYSNSNYISDGLNNAELFERALEFIEVANKEIYNSAELQHSISSTIRNLLVIKKFKPLVEYFEVGNWMRIRVDDSIYKLRLLKYEIDFDSLGELSSVDFSDVMKTADGISDQQSVIQQAASMATSYDSVQRQANKGASSNEVLNGWFENGLNATNTRIVGGADNQTQTWDEHGMLFRKYDSITDSYDDTQLKIINSTIAITTDNWKTVKTAIGSHIFYNPETGKLEQAYGVNAETLVGKLIIGESLGIYNQGGNMKFTDNGLEITNGTNTFSVNPNDDKLLKLSKATQDLLCVNQSGDLEITGKITATSGYIGGTTGFEIGSNYIRNGEMTSVTNTTIPGVYVGTDGFNVSGGTLATTSYFTKTGMNVGNKLKWDGTKLSVNGDITTDNIEATGGKISMFEINEGDKEGLRAYFDDGSNIYQYGFDRNRFFVFLKDSSKKFVGHIDLDNGLDENDSSRLPNLDIGSKGRVNISSGTEIIFTNVTYNENGIASYVTLANMTNNGVFTANRFEVGGSTTGDGTGCVKYTGAISTTSMPNYCAFDSEGIIKQYSSSSRKYKHNIAEYFDDTTNYKKLLELPVVTYHYNEGYCDDDGGKLHIGFIAEDIDKLYPVGCGYKNGKPENWNVMEIVPGILKLVQEHEVEINLLKSEINKLKGN